MSIKASDLRKGMGVTRDNNIWVVHSTKHIVKGKGQSYMQIGLKNVTTGQIIRGRFRVDETLEQAIFDRKEMEYLYSDGDSHVVMDPQTYDQINLPADLVGDQAVYLTPNVQLEVSFVEGKAVTVELPNTVELTVADTPPQVKGATATNQLKDAVCDGGARIKVPPFVENGQVVKVDSRSGEYLGRA